MMNAILHLAYELALSMKEHGAVYASIHRGEFWTSIGFHVPTDDAVDAAFVEIMASDLASRGAVAKAPPGPRENAVNEWRSAEVQIGELNIAVTGPMTPIAGRLGTSAAEVV